MIIALQTLIFFRESLIAVLDRFLRPYYKRLSFQFKVNDIYDDDDDSDEHVFAEFDDEKGVVFYPPVYVQRYAAVVDCLMDERWCGSLEKVVDFGYHNMSFIKYLKDVPGLKYILGVDIETIPVRCSSDLLECESYVSKRESPLQVTLFQGNAADPDYRLIGCDAVIAIEMIEHMLPHDLERFVHTVFGFIKPRVAIITTPNGDFNVLFKALEKNGLRRLDHFFEWSREQFHDWCSNIVARYPQYTVVSKGIGPGPPDTLHLGCCSQLALFYAKDYQKQPDLNLNSLALVAKAPSPNNLSDMTDSWETPDSISDNMLYLENNDESYTKLLINQQSFMTIVITTPSFSLDNLGSQDKMLQCNLDYELEKNFLFDDEVYVNVLIPRRKRMYRVYEIEDVASRLNCSMLQVKKFSKVTLGLLAKNKTDNFDHTREVVDEIRHLTKMLNFNKDQSNRNILGSIWCNINWGENAPYWNQYYKTVREYAYPFEIKSDECRILDAISEEINRLIDVDQPENFTTDTQKLEIPIRQLMEAVEHITTDVDKVKDLLEWNGYDVVDDVVIHTRLTMDNMSLHTQEEDLQEYSLSDWDTSDVRSNTISEGTATTLPDYNGRCLRRALDQKVRKLRKLLTADEDITIELDRIVCRLMKLALYTTKDRQDPPPASWMQCKLFDLLTLTEKAIERRRRHFLESYPLNSIEYCNVKHNDENIINTLSTDDSTVKDIVSKYNDVVAQSDFNIVEVRQEAQFDDIEFDDVVSLTTNDLEEYDDYNNDISPTHEVAEEFKKNVTIDHFGFEEVNNMKSINPQALQDSDHTELVSSPSCESNNYASNETLPNESNDIDNYSKVISPSTDITDISRTNIDKSIKLSVCKVNDTLLEPMYATKQKAFKNKSTKTKTVKKVSSKLINGQYRIKNRKIKEHQKLRSTLSKPIPDSMITLCNAEKYIEKTVEDVYVDSALEGHMNTEKVNNIFEELRDIAAAEDSLFVGIVSEYGEESIALRRNIGIDPIIDFEIVDNEVLETVINISKDDDFLSKGNVDTENLSSDTIFIYDINEPSTSKGVRHLSTDAQCGPDNSLTCATISATTSSTVIPNLFSNGMKIKNSLADIRVHKRKTNDFSTCTELLDPAPRLAGLPIAMGIKIKDSDIDIIDTSRIKCPTIVHAVDDKEIRNISNRYENAKETKLEKLKCSIIKIEDSSTELCGSLCSSTKPPTQFIVSSKNASENKVKHLSKINNLTERSQNIYAKNKLIFGGIHVHSFKERIYSEDVVYQGNWQRSRPLRRVNSKNSQELIIRRSKSLQKKKDSNPKKHMDAIKTLKNFNVIKPTHHSITSTVKQIKLNEANKKPLNKNKYKTLTKATSIMNMRSQKSQNKKQFYSKNYALDLNATRQNKDDLKSFKNNDYVPMSIRKKRQLSNENCDNTLNFDPRVKSCDKNNVVFFNALKEEITKELLKFTENMKINNNFIVLRNENETKGNTNKPISTTTTEIVDSNTLNRSIESNRSPPSQNSSPCSSPNSVATVRAVFTRNKAHRRDSPSSDRSKSGFESENKALRNKNCSKRYKSNKKSSNKPAVMCCNKENIPESSKNLFSKKDIPKTSNCAFVGKTKSVFMAQAATDHSKLQLTPPAVMKNNLKKPNTMYDISNNKHDNCLSDALNSNKLLKNSYDLDNSHSDCKEECSPSISSNNNVSTLQSIEDEQSLYSDNDKNDNSDTLDSPPSNSANRSLHSTRSSIMSAIRQLIEQKIHINESNSNDSIISASETIILNGEDINNSSFNSSLSPLSITTVIPNQNSTLESEIQNTLDKISRTGQNDLILSSPEVKPLTNNAEIDSISLKSSDLSSISTSKFSEYYLADNELENALNVSSVQDIFERNDRNVITNVDGLLAAQAFSGFSMNSGSLLGDRIDRVNLIDSETGSLALCSARQAVSEELFVSSRSSDTYESCFYEDDIYVPNWLFNIISQQPSIAESEVEEDFLPIPLGEPVFDVNGNALEPGVGFGAGAGDGRGMHSDQSQDSSGRGTSLSSSATSSGQNEPILIDLSTITPHYTQYVHEPMNVHEVSTDNDEINETHRSIEGDTVNDVFERVRNTNAVQITSDVDADVSSLDTDAIDSDD